MKDIALAILSVGLSFYEVYLWKVKKERDIVVGFVALVAALIVLF